MPPSSRPDLQQRLGWVTGRLHWLLALEQLSAIEPWPARLTPVPFGQDWLLGVAPVRGTVHSVVDLARLVGHQAALDAARRLVVVADTRCGHLALAVSAIQGLRSAAEMDVLPHAQAQALGAVTHPCVARVLRDPTGQCWHELAVAGLGASEPWLKLGQALVALPDVDRR